MPDSGHFIEASGVPRAPCGPPSKLGPAPLSRAPRRGLRRARTRPGATHRDTWPSEATRADAEGTGATEAPMGLPLAAQDRGQPRPHTPSSPRRLGRLRPPCALPRAAPLPPSESPARLTRLHRATSTPDATDAAATSAPALQVQRGTAPARRLLVERPLPAACGAGVCL